MHTLDNIFFHLKKAKKTQKDLCEYLGIKKQAFSDWKSGKSNSYTKYLPQIADYFGITVEELLGRTPKPRKKAIRVPVYGQVAAGIPMEAIQNIEDYEELDPDIYPPGEYIALKIRGNSMEPRMMNGDTVIIRLQEDINTGDTAVVFVGNDDATCKKIKRSPEGITLISTNPAFDPMFFSNKEIESLPIRILGKVVELRAKY